MLLRSLLVLTIAASPLMMRAADGVTLSARDEAFIHQLMNGCKAEIRTAEAALRRSLTGEERALATQLVATHQTVLRELRVIARSKTIATRDEVQADEQGRMVSAEERTDRDFNAFFLQGEIASAGAEIAACEVELRDGSDEDLRLFAATYLPGLRRNLAMAREFAAKY